MPAGTKAEAKLATRENVSTATEADIVKETPTARDTTQTSSAIATKQIRSASTSLARR